MKKKPLLINWKVIGIIMLVITIIILILLNNILIEKEKNGLTPFVRIVNGENTIYYEKNSSFINNITLNNEYLSLTCIPLNNDNISNITKSFLKNGKKDETINRVGISRYFSSTEEVFIEESNKIYYYNNSLTYSIINEKDLLNNTEIEIKAKEIIKKYRGNYNDLKVLESYNPKLIKGDSKSGNETIIGYTEQVIIFRQSIAGYEIKGGKGTILISFSKHGVLKSLQDDTLYHYKVTKTKSNMKSPSTQIQYLSNKDISLEEKSFILDKTNICFYFMGLENMQGYLNYEFILKGESSNNKYYEYVDCFI